MRIARSVATLLWVQGQASVTGHRHAFWIDRGILQRLKPVRSSKINRTNLPERIRRRKTGWGVNMIFLEPGSTVIFSLFKINSMKHVSKKSLRICVKMFLSTSSNQGLTFQACY